MATWDIMVICPYDLVRGLYKGTTILLFESGTSIFIVTETRSLIEGKTTWNVASDSEVTMTKL